MYSLRQINRITGRFWRLTSENKYLKIHFQDIHYQKKPVLCIPPNSIIFAHCTLSSYSYKKICLPVRPYGQLSRHNLQHKLTSDKGLIHLSFLSPQREVNTAVIHYGNCNLCSENPAAQKECSCCCLQLILSSQIQK